MKVLPKLIQEKMHKDELSLREAGEQIGISHMTVARALRGEQIDFRVIESIAQWLGVPTKTLIETHFDDNKLAFQIAGILETYPKLAQAASELLIEIKEGRIKPEVMADAFAYAIYVSSIKSGVSSSKKE
jgi:transcriptional regulator with XRE-family HTH domain